MKDTKTPWKFLDAYRDVEFFGKWPTLAQMFHISATRNPDRLCWSQYVPGDEISLTYREAESHVKGLALYLRSIGIGQNCHVAVTGKNSVYWAIAFYATCYSGAVVVPMDNSYTAEELNHLVDFGDIDFVFGDTERLNSLNAKNVISMPLNEVINYSSNDNYCLGFERCEDLAAILFTSGTTGKAKGVMLTNENLVSCCYQAQANMNICNTDVFYAILPIHHAYTLQAVFIEATSVGAHIVFGQKLVFSRIASDMKKGHVTMFLAVPLLFNKMIQGLMDGIKKKGKVIYCLIRTMMGLSGFFRDVFKINFGKKIFAGVLDKIALKDIRICISGGGPLPESTLRLFHQLGVDFVQGYGMTETSPITHLDPIYAFNSKSVGLPCANLEQKIINKDENQNGEICLRGSVVMKGYYKNPEATDQIIDSEGWINTGDVGHIDSKGYLYLTGRAKNIIVTEGGKNVFPEEIEDMFQLCDDFEQVCIIPYEIEKGTKKEGIRLLVLPSANLRKKYENSEDLYTAVNAVVEDVNRKMQPYKRITKTTILDEALETTSTKKIKRNEVIKRFSKI